MAADPVAVDEDVEEMVINRVIDNAAVAVASVLRRPVSSARAQALSVGRPLQGEGATVFGVEERVSPEWAAWANGVAVRELDFHDTFLAADYSHPGDNIPAVLAVAQHRGADLGLSGKDVVRGITTAYETQVNLVKGICLHKHKIDHVAHLGPGVAAGLGALLSLDPEQTSRPSARRCTPRPRPASPARAGAPAGRHTRQPVRGRWASRPLTVHCAERARPPRSGRARTA